MSRYIVLVQGERDGRYTSVVTTEFITGVAFHTSQSLLIYQLDQYFIVKSFDFVFISQENCVSLSPLSAPRSFWTELWAQERWISTHKGKRDDQSECTVIWRPMEAAGRWDNALLCQPVFEMGEMAGGFEPTMCVFVGVPEEDEWKDGFLQNLEWIQCWLWKPKRRVLAWYSCNMLLFSPHFQLFL